MDTKTWNRFETKAMMAYRRFCVKKHAKHYRRMFSRNGIRIRRLTKSQKAEIDDVWKGAVKDYSTHELCLTATGEFDPRICSELLFRLKIEPALNEQGLKRAWADKCYFDRLLPGAPFPCSVVRAVGCGYTTCYYGEQDQPISREEAIRLTKDLGQFIIKPSMENGYGRGVRLEDGSCDLQKLFDEYKRDFVVQKVVRQHEELAKLSARSLNIFRFMTCRLNGKARLLSASLRANEADAPNDNYVTEDGRGMVIVGVHPDGRLKEKGYYSSGISIDCLKSGVRFKGITVPSFEKMKQLAVHLSEKLGHFGFVAWDITVDEKGNPIVIEYNIKGPGIIYYQYANGPLFQEYTNDVIELFFK